jgi:tripartite-type tricarboxylate transporter receptor subunit TctC
MGGQIAVMYDGMVTSLPLIKAGKLQPYALAAKTRSPLLPDVPTFAELGYPDVDFSNWIGVVASGQMPEDLARKIQTAVDKAAQTPKVRARNAGIVKTFNIQP